MNSSIFFEFPITISLEINREEVLTLLKAFCFKEGDNLFWIDAERAFPNNRAIKPNTMAVKISVVKNYYRLEELTSIPNEKVYTWSQEFQNLLIKNIHLQHVVDGTSAGHLWYFNSNRNVKNLTKEQEYAFDLALIEDFKKMDFSDASLRQIEKVFSFIRRIQTQFWDECNQYYKRHSGTTFIPFGPKVKDFLFWFYFNYKNNLTEEHKIVLYSFKKYLTEEIKSGLIKIDTPDYCYVDFEGRYTNQEKEFIEILKHLPYGEIDKGGTSIDCYLVNNTLIKKGYSFGYAVSCARKSEKNPDYPSFKYEEWLKPFLAEHFPNKVPEFDFQPILFKMIKDMPYGIKKSHFSLDVLELYETKFGKKSYSFYTDRFEPERLDIVFKQDKGLLWNKTPYNKFKTPVNSIWFWISETWPIKVDCYNNNKFYVEFHERIYECDGIDGLKQCLIELNIYTL